MEKNNFDVALEQSFLDRDSFEQSAFEGDDYNRRSGFKRNAGKRIIRRHRGIVASPDLMVVNFEEQNHLFKKLKKGLKKVAAKVEKVALKVTPKPLRKIAKKVIAVHKKVGKAVGKVVAKVALYPALIPLIPVMAGALKKLKVKVPKDPGKMAEAFYRYVIKKEKPGNTYENSDHVAPAIAALIPPVIKFIKDMVQKKKAKKAGQAVSLDPVEDIVGGIGESVIDKIESSAIDEKIGAETSNESVLREPLQGESPLYMGDTGPAEPLSEQENTGTKKIRNKGGNDLKLMFKNPFVIGGIVLAVLVAFFLARRK